MLLYKLVGAAGSSHCCSGGAVVATQPRQAQTQISLALYCFYVRPGSHGWLRCKTDWNVDAQVKRQNVSATPA
jgi:hypothetical protein